MQAERRSSSEALAEADRTALRAQNATPSVFVCQVPVQEMQQAGDSQVEILRAEVSLDPLFETDASIMLRLA